MFACIALITSMLLSVISLIALTALSSSGAGFLSPTTTVSPGTGISHTTPFLSRSVSSFLDPKPDEQYVGELYEEMGFYQAIRLSSEPILRRQSEYQLIEVHESSHYGKILVLDGVLQLAEKDADAYNEMMTHIPMFQHRKPKRVLVIGGGDGYVVSEVIKHASVEHVDHVDLDGAVIETCKEHFYWSNAWNDPRVHLHIRDGAAFVREAADNSYDVIIQDSSDPWTWNEQGEKVALPSSVLYSREHFENIFRILGPEGVFNMQAETLQIPSDLEGIASWRRMALDVGFRDARYGSLMISSYATGQIGFLLCEKSPPIKGLQHSVKARFAMMCHDPNQETSYYHPRLQYSSFDLPRWAEKQIYGEKGSTNPECQMETDEVSPVL